MLRVEFHCHTIFSKDSLTSPEALVQTSQRRNIDRVVVTDHNSIAGALQAKSIDPERIIIGEEIMTSQGEILAAFVKEEIPPGLAPIEVINRLRQQEAFISVSHPFDRQREGHWEISNLLTILPLVDAIETFNSRCMQAKYNRAAQDFASQHQIPGAVGSDAHISWELGRATLILPDFTNANELRAVIRSGQPRVTLTSPLVHLTSRYAVWRKKLQKWR
jgi:predicted metal-dependent phosphoesterase TrpH